jgi:hypothetical protein
VSVVVGVQASRARLPASLRGAAASVEELPALGHARTQVLGAAVRQRKSEGGISDGWRLESWSAAVRPAVVVHSWEGNA